VVVRLAKVVAQSARAGADATLPIASPHHLLSAHHGLAGAAVANDLDRPSAGVRNRGGEPEAEANART
jgi:hypothetical protein